MNSPSVSLPRHFKNISFYLSDLSSDSSQDLSCKVISVLVRVSTGKFSSDFIPERCLFKKTCSVVGEITKLRRGTDEVEAGTQGACSETGILALSTNLLQY